MEKHNEPIYNFVGIQKKNQDHIIKVLNYCKEIRDTAYPLKDSFITELEIKTLTAVKEKDMVSITGALTLTDGERVENRCLEAYVMENKEELRIYLDITRLCVEDEPKLIRTSETIIDKVTSVVTVTKYNQTDSSEEKIFTTTLKKQEKKQKAKQLSAL